MKKEIKKSIIFWWLLATFLGVILGPIITDFNLFGSYGFWALKFNLPWVYWILDALILGTSIGFMQWLIVKKYYANSWLWILSTTGAWLIGTIVVVTLNILFTGKSYGVWIEPIIHNLIQWFFIGTSAGILQFLTMAKKINNAWLWIITSSIAWTFGGVIGVIMGRQSAAGFEALIAYPVTGLVVGITTGIVFYIILPKDRARPIDGFSDRQSGPIAHVRSI